MSPRTLNQIQMELITPKKAEEFLIRNTSNRKLRDGVAERYAQDMKDGKWTECPAPVVFYDNGDVADGQHRLWAIILSGQSQHFFVLYGLPRTAGLNIDTGAARTLVDNARISGIDGDLSNELLCVARCVNTGSRFSGKGVSSSKKLEYVEAHRDAVMWAVKNGPRGKYVRNSMTLAAVARAWYCEQDMDKLQRFCTVFANGFAAGDQESAAVAMRNFLVDKGTSAVLAVTWRESFLKMQNSIFNFMRDRKLTRILKISEEMYPLKKSLRVSMEGPIGDVRKKIADKKAKMAAK